MSRMQQMLQEQQQDLEKLDQGARRLHAALAHTRVTAPEHLCLPELEPINEGDQEWLRLVKQVESCSGDVFAHLTPEGAVLFASLKLTPKDLHAVLVGIARDAAYAKEMNACIATLGRLLQDFEFVDAFAATMQSFCARVLNELQDTMAALNKLYHTECHSAELAIDVATHFQLTALPGTPDYERQCGAKALLIPMALYHDLIQTKGPPLNERHSAHQFVLNFERDFRPLLTRQGKVRLSNPDTCIKEGAWDKFRAGLKQLAVATIVSGTGLTTYGAPLKVLEMQLRRILRDHVNWREVDTKSKTLFLGVEGREKTSQEVDKMALLLSHYDTSRFCEEGVAVRAAQDARTRLDRLSGEDESQIKAGVSAPWDLQLRDFTWQTGFFVLAGQSLRMMGELTDITMDSGEPYVQLFHRCRLLCDDILLESKRDELRRVVAEGCTLVRHSSKRVIKGALYNVFLYWLRNDLSFIADRDLLEAQKCLDAEHPGHVGNSLGSLMGDAGQLLLDTYARWSDPLMPVQKAEAEGVEMLEDDGLLTQARRKQKVNCGVALMYATCRQDGWIMGSNAALTDLWKNFAQQLKLI